MTLVKAEETSAGDLLQIAPMHLLSLMRANTTQEGIFAFQEVHFTGVFAFVPV